MNKLLRFFMLAALLLPFALKAQTMYLTVADSTATNAYVPVYGNYMDDPLGCQSIYPASMLTDMVGENILSLSYYVSSGSSSGWGSDKPMLVKLMIVTENDLSAGYIDVTNATTVYNGTISSGDVTADGGFTVNFTTPFMYTGGNLLVSFQINPNDVGGYSAIYWYGKNITAASRSGYGDGNYNYTASGTVRNFLPKTTFMYGTPPTCFKVTNQAIDETLTTTSSLTLTWMDTINTGATYNIYDMSDTTLVQSGVTGTTFTIDNLPSNTGYTFGIQTDCGGGDMAAGYAIVSGRTACAAMSLPWTCGFESDEIVSTTQVDALPWCSSRYSVPSTVSSPNYPYSYSASTSSYLHSGSRCLYFYGATSSDYPDTMSLILPEVDVTLFPMSGNRLTFWARSSSTSYDKVVYVGTLTDPADMSTYALVDSITVMGTTYTKYSLPLTAVTGNPAYLAITVMKGSGSLYIDDMTIEEMPSCLEVTGLTVTATTSSSIALSWVDAANTGATYTIYDMADNSVVGTSASTTYTVDNLTANTQYTFGVQANCTSGDAPFTTVTALTDCAIETMPWSENFDNWTDKSPCWMFMSGLLSEGTPTVSTSAWTLNSSYGSYITLNGNALTMNLYSTNRYWALTPPIEITSDNAMLSVDVAVAAWSAAEPNYDINDTLAFLVTTNDGASFTLLQAYDYNQLNAFGNTYTTLYIPAAGYNGQTVRFAIYGGSVSGTSPYDNRIAIDNVSVSASSSCLPVANLTTSDITSYGATLNWVGQAASYTIYDMADTTVIQSTTDTNVVINSLNPDTQYTLGVQANCGSDQSVIVNVSFTTLVTCPAPANLAVTLTPGDGTVASLSWTEVGTATAWQICLNGDTNNLIDVTTNPYDLTGLTPEQAYTAQVRAYCDANDQSAWSDLVNFTPTNAYTVTVNDGTSTNNYVPIYGLWVDDITKSQFIIPASDLAAMQYGTINKLTFYSSNANVNWGVAEFNVYLTETNATTLSDLADYNTMTQVYAGTLSISNNIMEVTLTTPYLYMGGNLMVGFLQTLSGTYSSCSWYGVSATGASMGGYGSSVSQRNFLPKTTIAFTPGTEPTCPPVTSLTATNITGDAATLTWNGTADSYNVYVITPTDTTFVQNVTSTSFDLTTLTPMTAYTYGVRAVCNGDESDIRTVTFTTACAAVSLPYTETFESTSNTRECWDLVATGNIGGSNGMGFVTVSDREVLRFSSYSDASDYNQYGYSPLMDVSSTATNLLVNVVYATYGSNDKLNFGYVTATDTVWFTDEYTTTGNTDWQTLNFVVPATATHVAIHYYGNYQYYAWIDTVTVAELSGDYCYAVTNLGVDNVTQNSVSLSWTDNHNTGITYTVYNGTTVVASNVAATSYVVNGLAAATTYTFGVVANCSATSESDMVTVTATTECADITSLPYYEGFENGLGCWTTVNGSSDGMPWNVVNNASYAHGGTKAAVSFSYYSYSPIHANAWLISPKFVLPSVSNDSLAFSWWHRVNDSYPTELYDVKISTTTNDTAAFTTTLLAVSPDSIDGYVQNTVDLTAYAGQEVYIAFRHHDSYNQDFLLIDDISLYQGAYIPPTPDTLEVTFAVNDATMGTTVPAPGTYNYLSGDTVFFSATPNTGYHFIGWEWSLSLGVDTLGAQYISAYFPANALMSYGSMTFTALFEADSTPTPPTQFTVTLNTADATMGSVSPAGANTVNAGSSFTATATAADGYQFVAWMDGNTQVSQANPYTFTVNADITLTATFSAIPVEPCAVPTGLAVAADGLHNESIDVVWDNADVDGWNIQWRVGNGTWASGHSTTNSYTINGLATETTYEIQVQADCGDNNLSDWSASITATTTNVGIDSYLENSVSLYPNPAKEVVNVQCTMNNVQLGGELHLFDVYGKLLQIVPITGETTAINVSDLADGMYFVRVSTDAGTVTKTFVKR